MAETEVKPKVVDKSHGVEVMVGGRNLGRIYLDPHLNKGFHYHPFPLDSKSCARCCETLPEAVNVIKDEWLKSLNVVLVDIGSEVAIG